MQRQALPLASAAFLIVGTNRPSLSIPAPSERRTDMMRALKIAAVALAFALTSPGLAAAQESLAAGAAAGALAGGLAGGPVGAAIGGAGGAAIGGAAQTHVPV